MTPQWIEDLTDAELAALLADPSTPQSLHAALTIEVIGREGAAAREAARKATAAARNA